MWVTAERSTYSVVVATELKPITAFRLEALTHDGLPQQGPGQAGGNFVLNEFRVTVVPNGAAPLAGRYVRIELPGSKQILSLAELEKLTGVPLAMA